MECNRANFNFNTNLMREHMDARILTPYQTTQYTIATADHLRELLQIHNNFILLKQNKHTSYVAVRRLLPTARAQARAQSDYVGFVVDKVSLRQVSSEYFGFPCQLSIYHCSTFIMYHPGLVQWTNLWPTYQVDSVFPPLQETKIPTTYV
jgi:hypothetical protein